MAGEVSKEICKKYIFDDELLNAHSSGIIHIHKQYCGLAA